MQNKSKRDAILSIINRIKNSETLFKKVYDTYKDKFDKIEENIETYEQDLEHMNKSINMFKWLLFTSKTKEDLFQNMDLFITRPDGSPI